MFFSSSGVGHRCQCFERWEQRGWAHCKRTSRWIISFNGLSRGSVLHLIRLYYWGSFTGKAFPMIKVNCVWRTHYGCQRWFSVYFIQLWDLTLLHVPWGRSDSLWVSRVRNYSLFYQWRCLNACILPQLNILTCGFIGSYSVVLAFDSYSYTSLSHITLNVLKRALNVNFHRAFTNVPFQTNGKTKSKNQSDSQVRILAHLC